MPPAPSPYARPWWVISLVMMVLSTVTARLLPHRVHAVDLTLGVVCLVSILSGSWLFVEWCYARTWGRYDR